MALITTNSPPLHKLIHPTNRALRKFCFCINLRAGVVISCTVWAALGLYFAALAFQGQSPFYSFLAPSALTVSGVINLLMVLVGLTGYAAAWINEAIIMRNLSHFVWAMMLLLLGDHFINVIIFSTNQADFRARCTTTSQDSMNEQISAAFPNGTSIHLSLNTNHDLYNCDRLWVDELKFSVLAYVFMFLIYIYWATTIWSYSHKRAIIDANKRKAAAQSAAIAAGAPNPAAQSHPGGVVSVPPMSTLPAGMNQMPMQFAGAGTGMGRGNIIVLNNEKPSKKNSPSPVSNDNYSDSGYSGYSRDNKSPFFGFKIGYDGVVRELEQQDVDVELGRAAQAAVEADNHHDTDSGIAGDLSGPGDYDGPHSKRSSRILTRKPVNSSNEHSEYGLR